MKVTGRDLLDSFVLKHQDTRQWIQAWLLEVENAAWKTPQEIKLKYASASFLADNIVFFNVKGNDYRLRIQVAYKFGVVVIKWVGTHKEYTKLFCKGK